MKLSFGRFYIPRESRDVYIRLRIWKHVFTLRLEWETWT